MKLMLTGNEQNCAHMRVLCSIARWSVSEKTHMGNQTKYLTKAHTLYEFLSQEGSTYPYVHRHNIHVRGGYTFMHLGFLVERWNIPTDEKIIKDDSKYTCKRTRMKLMLIGSEQNCAHMRVLCSLQGGR